MRINGSDEMAMDAIDRYRAETDGPKTFVTPHPQVLRAKGLNRGDRARLFRLINGPVAAMTAEQLSGLLDDNLEADLRYTGLIGEFQGRVSDPRTPIQELLDFLARRVPTRRPSEAQTPNSLRTAEKVLFIEAVARQLGKRWTDDSASFIDVSIACARLQDIAQALTMEASRQHLAGDAPFAAIVVPRGEQHTLMSHLIGALFQTIGWHQEVLLQETLDTEIFARRLGRADVVCIGWSNMRLQPDISHLIREVRLCSKDKTPPIIAGGVAALDFVDFLTDLGIACLCDSAYSAVSISQNYYSRNKSAGFGTPRHDGSENVIPRFDRPRR